MKSNVHNALSRMIYTPAVLYSEESQAKLVLHGIWLLSISHLSCASCAYGLSTRRPSFGGAAARLNDYTDVSLWVPSFQTAIETDVVTLFPCSSGTESETNECRPCTTLEEENGEDDTKAEAETGADHHRGETAVPLRIYCQHSCLVACGSSIIALMSSWLPRLA
jgi:hypothetical protein